MLARTLLAAVLTSLAALGLSTPAATAHTARYVYWANLSPPMADGTTIGRSSIAGLGIRELVSGAAAPCGIAVNSSHVYWQNSGDSTIARANRLGSNPEQSFIDFSGAGCGVAVDATHVYWAANGRIARAELDGSPVEDPFVTTPAQTCGVAVNSTHVFWVNAPGNVGRASLSSPGTPDNDFVTGVRPDACGVAVDANYIYWGNNTSIGRANLADGGGALPDFIPPGAGASNPSTPAVDAAYLYWANSQSNTIGRANIDGTGINHSFATGTDGAVGVAVDPIEAAHDHPVNEPSNQFTFGELNRNKKRGTATQTVVLPGPGTLDLSGSGVKPRRPLGGFHPRHGVAGGEVTLLIKAAGIKRLKLKDRGKVKVTPSFTFTPSGGTPATQTKTITLKRSRKK